MCERIALSRKIRFEVFKRDSFACQYCGQAAPTVVLEIDHIQPVSKDGDNDVLNLITSCKDCNSGKSDRELSDDTVIQKRKAQLDELQERREQIEMMLEWQRDLIELGDSELDAASSLWQELIQGYRLNDHGLSEMKKYIRRFGLADILTCIRLSTSQYLEIIDGKPTSESVAKAFDFLPRICVIRLSERNNPQARELYYIRGIVRNRHMRCDQDRALDLLEQASHYNVPSEFLRSIARSSRSWSSWLDDMYEIIEDYYQRKVRSDG